MKTLKKVGLSFCVALCLCSFCGLSVTSTFATGNENVSVVTDFTALNSLSGVSGIVETKGVSVGGDDKHGAIPSATWADPSLIADSSYIIYEIDATANGADRIFDTVNLKIDGIVWNQDNGTAHNENAVNVYTGLTEDSVTNLVHSYKPENSNNKPSFYEASNTINFAPLGDALDLSAYFKAEEKGYDKVYIKVELVQSKVSAGGTTANADGTIALGFIGVKLSNVEINATTKVGEKVAIVYDFDAGCDFTKHPLNATNPKAAVGVCSDSNVHGLVPGEAWGGEVSIPAQSYVIYEIKVGEQKVIDKLFLDISGKLWGQGNDAAYAYNSIIVSFSKDNIDYVSPITLKCSEVGNKEFNLSDFNILGYDASNYIPKNSNTIYIKIELKQYVANTGDAIELNLLGTKLYSIRAAGMVANKVDIAMEEGAYIRYGQSSAGSGLRFAMQVGAADYTALAAKGATFGMIILPYEYITNNEGALYHLFDETIFHLSTAGENTNNLQTIINLEFGALKEDGDKYVGYGTIAAIKETNLDKKFVGIGYVKYNGNYIIANFAEGDIANNVRSVREVAQAIVADDAVTDQDLKDWLTENYITPVTAQ